MAYSLKEINKSDKAHLFVLLNGNYNLLDDIKGLYPKDYDKLLHYFQQFADKGQIFNVEIFKQLSNNIFEFKTKNVRVLCFLLPGRRPKTIILNHYRKKQKRKSPSKEIDKAQRISNEIIELFNTNQIEFGE